MTTPSVRRALAVKLRELRGERSQSEVARACALTSAALSNYEAGRRYPSVSVLIRLARYYDVTLTELVSDE